MKICVKNITKLYKPQCNGIRGLFDMKKSFTALDNVSFEINSGESVGIIGKNGSGKSTLLKILCSVTSPTDGEIITNGRISALLELGTGFNPEYTGISNIYLNGTVMGLKKSEIKKLVPKIAAFADIGDYISRPVKTYSDGMFMRLAFACAVSVTPDILIIDEAFSVGDFAFRQKCFKKLEEMKNRGTTIILVSHDIDTLRRFCDRAIWLDKGAVRMDGSISEVSAAYMESVTGNAKTAADCHPKASFNNIKFINRFGSAKGSVSSLEVSETQITDSEQIINIYINIPAGADLNNLALSISFKDISGLDLTVISTADTNIRFKKHGKAKVTLRYRCRLCPGRYSLNTALEDRAERPIKYYDYIEGAAVINVISPNEYFGLFRTDADFEIKEQ